MSIGALAQAILTTRLDAPPERYPRTADGLTRWLPRFRHFSALELVRPVARPRRGPRLLVPPPAWWYRVLRLGLLADAFREAAGRPVRIRYLYRSPSFNRERHGAAASDHLTAHAVDLQVLGLGAEEAAERARQAVVWPLYERRELEVSVGEGTTITHVGLLSPRGRRRWRY